MIILIISALLIFAVFVFHCLRDKNPLLDLTLFKNRYFSYSNIAMFLISGFLAGNNFIMPFFLYDKLNFSELNMGFVFMIYSASYMIFSLIYGKISYKINSALISSVAAFLSFISVLLFSLNINNTNIIHIVLLFIISSMINLPP